MLLGELAGLQLSGEYGCAHSLIDKVVQMIEDDVMLCRGVTSARNKNKRCRMLKKGRELKTDGVDACRGGYHVRSDSAEHGWVKACRWAHARRA